MAMSIAMKTKPATSQVPIIAKIRPISLYQQPIELAL